MQNVSRLRILLPTLAAVFALAALTYGLVTPKQFEVSASILVRRTAIEPIEGAGEAGKNRWVWVRDGLALKEELSSDATLMEIVRDVPDLSARKDSFCRSSKFNRGRSPCSQGSKGRDHDPLGFTHWLAAAVFGAA